MRYFIYPKGGHGRTLAEMIKFLDQSVEIAFIDDYYAEISLKAQKEEILKSGDKVLLALEQKNPYSRVIMQKLIANLKEAKITNYAKAVLWYSSKIVEFAREKVLQKGWIRENTLAVGVYNHAGEKHLGFVDEELKKQSFNVLYLCSNDVAYQRYSKKDSNNSLAIPLVIEHFDLVDFVWGIYMTTPLNYKNPSVKYFYQPHGIADFLENILRFGGVEETMEIIRHADYVVAPTKLEVEILKKALQEYCLESKVRVLEGGYPAFEVVREQILESKNEVLRDSLLVAVSDEEDLLAIKEGIALLLEKGIKVIFRPRPYWNKTAVDNFQNDFLAYSNFSLDNADKIQASSYQKSFAVLTTASSVGYTFPLTTFCPAILYFKDRTKLDSNFYGYAYFNSILHKRASTPLELLEATQDLACVQKNQAIMEYKNAQVFHLGSASLEIAKSIKAIHKEDC